MAKVSRRPAAKATRRAAVHAGSPTLPGWVAPLTYALVTLLLFREVLTGVSLLGTDTMALSYFARNFYTEFVHQFQRMPHWNPLLFGGLPFVEGMHGDIFYPPSLALFFMDARTMWGWKLALHIFLAGAFMHLWLRRGLGLGSLAAFFGGLVYMMGAQLVSLVLPGGDGKLFVAALAPLVFWLTERAAARRRPADYAAFALGLALILFTSHMQSAYYCVWGVSLYFLFRVWQRWRADRNGAAAGGAVGAFAVAGVLGVAAAAVQFLPPLEYLREFSHRVDRAQERGYEWSSTYSLNAEEVVSLAVPEFVGQVVSADAQQQPGLLYWGQNPLKLNHEYAGLVPLLLIPVLLVLRRTPQVWFFTVLAALALLYALASSTPIGRLFYLVPGVSLFRSWSIIIYVWALAVVTLAAIAVQQLQDWLLDGRAEQERATARRTLWITAGAFGVVALLAASGALAGLWTSVIRPDIDPRSAAALARNSAYITAGFWIAFGIALAVAGAWHAASSGMLSARALVIVLAVIAAADLYRVGRPFVATTAALNRQVAASTLARPDDVIAQLQRLREAGGVFRVADISGLLGGGAYRANDLAIHGLEQLAGHHGNELGRYRNLIGGEHAENLATSDLRLANVTNTEYLVSPARVEHPALEEIYAGQHAVIYRNRNVLPRAYLVGTTEIVPDDAAAIERLLAEDFGAATTAILPGPLPAEVEVQAGATGVVEWLERGTDEHRLRVSADRPALLIVLDNWYPAWQATVGGQSAPVLRANHTFRAIPVPPGEHIVTLRYAPDTLRGAALMSMAVLLLLGVVYAVDVLRARRAARTAAVG